MTSYPPEFLPIEKAFEEAVARLAPETRTLATDEHLLSVDEEEADRIYQLVDEAERRVEKLFRDALADGPLGAWVKSGEQMEILSEPGAAAAEAWRPEAFGIPGLEPTTHHLANPGPNDDREVFIERKALKEWLDDLDGASSVQPATAKRGRPPKYDWDSIEAFVRLTMDEREDFDAAASEWNHVAKLYPIVKDFCSDKFGEVPVDSGIEPKVRTFVENWRADRTEKDQ